MYIAPTYTRYYILQNFLSQKNPRFLERYTRTSNFHDNYNHCEKLGSCQAIYQLEADKGKLTSVTS